MMKQEGKFILNTAFILLSGMLFFAACEKNPEDEPLEAADPSGTLFVATYNGTPGGTTGTFYALDAATGEIKWTKYVGGFPNTPTIANGKLFFRSSFDLKALDTATREVTTIANLTDGHWGTPTYYDNKVYVKDGSGEKGFNVVTGNMDFYASTGGGDVSSSATIDNGILISTKVNLWGVNANTGSILWTTDMDIVTDRDANPAVYNGVAYMPSAHTADFYAVKTATGELLWDYHFSEGVSMSGTYSSGSPTVKNGKVFFTSFDSMAIALNASTGELIWKKRLNNGAALSSPVVSGNRLFITVFNQLCALDVNTGETVWSVSGPFARDPTYSNGCIFTAENNKIVCYNATNGMQLWQKDLGAFSTTNMLVVDKNKKVYHSGTSGEMN